MLARIQEFNRHFTDLWWDCDTARPDLGSLYTARAQTENETLLLQLIARVDRMFSHPPHSREEAQALQRRLGEAFKPLAEAALGAAAAQMNELPSQAFSDASEEFIRQARAFDAKLSGEEIYQAGRNAWTANGLQCLLGIPVEVTPAILAYSLLYPYTDNYLDDPGISLGTKLAFNERFRRRLAGETLAPINAREKTIFDLVAMIEGQYSRSSDPALFESLLAIHHAQGQSLRLTRRAAGEVDVVGLSFYKGGTSVLADGYLVSASLDQAQRQYTYGHGIFAQLLDDLEDLAQDSQAGRLTVYSQVAGKSPLDALANRTIHFGRQVLAGLDCFKGSDSIRALIERGADLFLIDAIGRMDRYYSEEYLRELESHSPFRFSFLKDQRENFFKQHGSPGKLMDMIMLLQAKP